MRKIKVVVLLVQQLQHGFTKNAKVSPNLTVAHILLRTSTSTRPFSDIFPPRYNSQLFFSPLETISTSLWASLHLHFPVLSVFSHVSCHFILFISSPLLSIHLRLGSPFFSSRVRPCPSFFLIGCLLLFS